MVWKSVLVVDDVITVGIATRETTGLVASGGGKVGVYDGELRLSAKWQFKQDSGMRTAGIVPMDDLNATLKGRGEKSDIERLVEYCSLDDEI